MVDTPPQTDTYSTALDIFDRTHPLRVDVDENLKVTGTFTPSGTQDVNIVSSIPIPVSQSGSWTVSLTSGSIEIGTVDQGTGGASPWLIDGSVSISNFPSIQPVSQSGVWTTGRTWTLLNTTDSVNIGNFPATQPISGSVSVSNFPASQVVTLASTTITGNVTAVQSTGSNLHVVVDSAPSTTVTGTVTAVQPTGTNLHVVVDTAPTTAVTGTFFQSVQPVSIDQTSTNNNVKLVSGSTTAVTQATGTNLHIVVDSGAITVSQGTGSNLHAVLDAGSAVIGHVIADTGSTTTVTGNVTVVQSTGTNLHTVIDSGTITAVTAITNALPVGSNVIGHVIADTGSTTTVTGNVTVVQGTGTNLHTVVDSGTITAVTAITNALPAGANVIGHVIADSGSTTVVTGNVTVVQPTGTNLHTVVDSGSITATQATGSNLHTVLDSGTLTTVTNPVTVTQGTAAAVTAGWPITSGSTALSTATWTSATTINTTLTLAVTGYGTAAFTELESGTITVGTIVFEGSIDGGTNWFSVLGTTMDSSGTVTSQINLPAVSIALQFSIPGLTHIRARLSNVITGSGSVTVDFKAFSHFGPTFVVPVQANGYQNNVRLQDVNGNNSTLTSTGALNVNVAVTVGKATYAASGTFTPAATPTDLVIIEGSATKKVRVVSFRIVTTNTAAGSQQFFLIKRSAADTTGTFVGATKVPLDSSNAAATVNRVGHFTANPGALGAAVGTVATRRVVSPVPVPASFAGITQDSGVDMLDFLNSSQLINQSVVLRGVAETLALNFNGAALVAGQTHAYTVLWTEE